MSSAALQSAPHQSSTVTALASNSPTAAPISNRQYTSQGQPSRDPYYNQQQAGPNASPTSTRRPSRRPSGNGAPPHAQNQQYYASPSNASDSSPIANSRSAHHTSSSAAAAAMQPASDRGPPVAPPRTSSNQQRNSGTAAAAAASGSRPSSSRRAQGEQQQYGRASMDGQGRDLVNGTGDRQKDDTMAAAAAAAAASGSRQQRPDRRQQEQLPYRSNSNRENRSAESPVVAGRSRNAGNAAPSSTASREASEVLNRMVISQPEVDLEREQERLAEAVPLSLDRAPESQEENIRGPRSRQDHSSSKREKSMKFGEYFLGNTLGEGEFGKVKMGWKQAGGVQVAIKLIRRDSVGTNPTRLAKIYREIAILREISHPNIVRLHEMVETDRYIGIILEYASGGELFDYILNHRYLKDNAARRLFAQLVSGVGYLHKKGIVHRDLKLENLLLDRNRNIIITDFGFANTFDARDELGDEVEYNLSSREYVKRMELDKVLPNGHRRGDLMQTSCGSPCYAAPELVVSDSLYTGRKVDVWSCGVILYAMLAGYLPFDDDPANPEGDNINLLYKYIVSTPLTFPEYVTPHARDLLRRILVPDPRKRADLFEVARHSWLSEYAHVVGFITSSTTTTADVANQTPISNEDGADAPGLVRSASVREPSKAQKATPSAVGDLARKHGNVDQDADDAPPPKTSRDNKRRTVQVEYVAPRSETVRGGSSSTVTGSSPRTRVRTSEGPVEVAPGTQSSRRAISAEKPLPLEPGSAGSRQSGSHRQQQQAMPPPSRPVREPPRSVSDTGFMQPLQGSGRPATGGSMTSVQSRTPSMGLPSRGSYGQPVAPTVAGTNAHGRMAQPNMDRRGSRGYVQSMPQTDEEAQFQQLNDPGIPPKSAKIAGYSEGGEQSQQQPQQQPQQQHTEGRGHKRSNTVGGISEKIFGRGNSMFGGTRDKNQEKPKKSYPPVSMHSPVGETPRQSQESRRPTSFGFVKKRSGSIGGSQDGKSRRFSLLPTSFSLKAIGIGKDYGTAGAPPSTSSRPSSRGTEHQNTRGTYTGEQMQQVDGSYESIDSPYQSDRRATSTASPPQQQQQPRYSRRASGIPDQRRASSYAPTQQSYLQPEQGVPPTDSESSFDQQNQQRRAGGYPPGFNDYDKPAAPQAPSGRGSRGVLQKNNRKFTDAYGDEEYSHKVAGSSGAARKVMDFFRLRGRARNGDDR